MIKIKNPSPRKLGAYFNKNDFADATILHFTGNMWGIGARLSSYSAIHRINLLKQRQKGGLIALVPDIRWFDVEDIQIPARLRSLLQQYWPGNLSVSFHVNDARFEHIALNGKTAFRVPTDPLLRIFIEMLGEPMISTSINYSNMPAETDPARIEHIFGKWFDYGLYPHPRAMADSGTPSTIVEYVSKSESGIEELVCHREGSIPFYEVRKSFDLPLVMFVCTANICRSPIAEKLFNQMIKKENLRLIADSSGLIEGGHMISLSSMQLLMQRGIEEAPLHMSKQITPQMVAGSWLVLTMEERQRDFLRGANPNSAHKIMTLNEIAGYEGDIVDPYGSDLESYRKTFDIIEDRLTILMEKITSNDINFDKDTQ